MADNSQKNNIAEQFSSLPENIKKWLSSEELVFIITDIETKLGLSDEKILIIPKLILRLVVQDLAPQNFIHELSQELGVDFNVAKTITEDIEKNALRPIASELRDKLGLEVKLIYYGKAGGEKEQAAPTIKPISSAASIAKQPSLSATTPPPAQIKLEKQMSSSPSMTTPFPPAAKPITAAPTPIPKTPVIKKLEPAFESATPFILHQESSPTSAPSLNQNTSMNHQSSSSLPKTSLTMKVQNYFQAAGTPERTAFKPVSIKVEAPSAQQTATQTEKIIPIMKQPIPMADKPEIPPVKPLSMPATPKEQALTVNSTNIPAAQTPSISSPAGQAGPIPSASSGQARVVNYSNLRTPIDNLGLPKKDVAKDNVVDLRKFM